MILNKILRFDSATHSYFYDNIKIPSCSSLIKEVAPFTPDPNIPSDVISLGAMRGIAKGNATHDVAEQLTNLMTTTGPALIKFFYERVLNSNIVLSEKPLYSNKYKICGTPDLLIEKNKKFILYDYKTNKYLRKPYGMMEAPFDDMENTALNKYFLQQTIYEILLEENGYPVDKKYIVWLKDDLELIRVPRLKRRVKLWLQSKLTSRS